MEKLLQIVGLILTGVIGAALDNIFSAAHADIVGIYVITVIMVVGFILTATLEKSIFKSFLWITSESLAATVVILVKTSLVYSSLTGSAIMAFWGLVIITPLLAILVWAFYILSEKK